MIIAPQPPIPDEDHLTLNRRAAVDYLGTLGDTELAETLAGSSLDEIRDTLSAIQDASESHMSLSTRARKLDDRIRQEVSRAAEWGISEIVSVVPGYSVEQAAAGLQQAGRIEEHGMKAGPRR